MKKPNFFIVGAPKCGTTSLAYWLSCHPNIYMSPVKEPHYFNTDGLRWVESKKDYEALFAKAGPEHMAVGEASTNYLFSRAAVPGILEYNPEAKFIVCLRNPVEAAPSLHAQRLYSGLEAIRDFRTAWEMQEERKRGLHIPSTLRDDPLRLQYGEYCRYGEQLSRLFKLVSPEVVKVVLLEEMRDHPSRIYADILDFLGVPLNYEPEFRVLNQAKRIRSIALSMLLRKMSELKNKAGIRQNFGYHTRLSNMNARESEKPVLDPELRVSLIRYFEDDIRNLMVILDKDLSEWLE